VTDDPTGDDGRWTQAQMLLDELPTASAGRDLRAAGRMSARVVSLVLAAAAVVVAAALIRATLTGPVAGDVSTWRVVARYLLAYIGLVVLSLGMLAEVRASRRLDGWGGPLQVLTDDQRAELLSQVRGDQPIPTARLPLARHMAETVAVTRMGLVPGLGVVLMMLGHGIAEPTGWQLGVSVVVGALIVVGWATSLHRAGRVRRFLARSSPLR